MLLARGALGTALLDAGQLEQARTQLEGAIRRYRSALAAGHPLAAALELDLARLELLEGRAESARARLAAQRATLVDNFPETSIYRRQLACLDAGNTDAACWR